MALFEKFSFKHDGRYMDEKIEHIIENLNNILNTKRNFGAFIRDFGIRDMNEYTNRDQISLAVMEEVKSNIEKFEPRVKLINMEIGEDDNPFYLSFKIDCIVLETKKTLRMIFDSVYSNVELDEK